MVVAAVVVQVVQVVLVAQAGVVFIQIKICDLILVLLQVSYTVPYFMQVGIGMVIMLVKRLVPALQIHLMLEVLLYTMMVKEATYIT